MEDLVQQMAPRAADLVPDEIKKDLVKEVTKVLQKKCD